MGGFGKTSRGFGFNIVSIIMITMATGVVTSTAWQSNKLVRGQSARLGVTLPPMNLTLVALNGTQLVLNEVDIGNLPSYASYGGYKNVLGNIRGLGKYTGVNVTTFCNLAGGITSNNSLRITAADSYTATFSYDEVSGGFVAYDNVTGEEVPHSKPLTPILAYYFNDADLPEGDGPLRLAIVGPEGLATFSGYWVKQVAKLEIRYRDQVNVTAINPSKTAVGQNFPCPVNVTVANQGVYDENFSLTAYANQTSIGTQTVMLPAGNSFTVTFTWNTAGFTFGNYSILARVNSDPPITDGIVRLSVPGDVNGNGKVDIYDAIILAGAYGSTPKTANWNPNADINGDQTTDIYDAIILANNYGKTA